MPHLGTSTHTMFTSNNTVHTLADEYEMRASSWTVHIQVIPIAPVR